MPKKKSGRRTRPATIAGMTSMLFDLDFVVRACDLLLLDPPLRKSDDKVLEQALWISAVVMYARCFGSGTRFALPSGTMSRHLDNDQQRQTHARILHERDKYVAHVVLSRDELAAIEQVREAGTDELRGHTLHFRRFTHDAEEAQRLRDLAVAVSALGRALLREGLAQGARRATAAEVDGQVDGLTPPIGADIRGR